MTPALLVQLVELRAGRRCVVVASRIGDGMQRLLVEPEADGDAVETAAAECVRSNRSERRTVAGEDWFLHLHAPAPRLIVVGAVHIAQGLVDMARLLRVDTVVCDPRGAYATEARFPLTRLRTDWPDAAVREERPDRHTGLVVLSHDPKLDDPALLAALDSRCGYIGALGSRRSHAARLARLADAGAAPGALARILGPVGLDIHAVGAEEIAVSILAEWIAHRRGAPMRER